MSDIAFSVIVNNNGIDDIVFKTIMLKGDKGNSVDHVEKTSTSGLVDTYTIYLTDGTIGGTFTVTNGSPVNIDDTVTAIDKTWSSNKLSGMIKSIDDNVVNADKLWSSQKINSMLAQTGTIEDVAMASFSDGADDLPLSELIVDIEAWQEGSGEPSPDNERAIHGWSECNLSRAGVNLFDKTTVTNGYLINGSGNQATYAGWNISDFIPVPKGASLYFNGLTTHPNSNQDNFMLFDANKNKIGYSNVKTYEQPFIVPEGVKYIKCCVIDSDLNTAQLSLTNNAPYQSYMDDTATIEFGQTIYGGKLNILSGLMTVTHAKAPFSSIADANGWNRTGAGIFYIYPLNNALPNCKYPFANHPISTHFEYQASGTLEDGCFRCSDALYFSKNDETDIASCKAWLRNTDGSFVYELSEPQTIQLTPTEVKTLLGVNNIFADTGNVEKIVYFKTGSEAVAKLIEAYMRAQPEE